LALGNVKQLDFVCEFGGEGFEKRKEQAEGIERTVSRPPIKKVYVRHKFKGPSN
jgi:hypothetical protein